MPKLLHSIVLIFLSTNTYAASFSCHTALTFVEKAICKDSELSMLDVKLNKNYKLALKNTENPDQLKTDQRNWLKYVRNQCQTSGCLKEAYQKRNLLLEVIVAVKIESEPEPILQEPDTFIIINTMIAEKPLEYWLQRYWQWIRSFPPGKTPSNDASGELCNAGQIEPVFFLTGSSQSMPVVRHCSMVQGQYLLVPAINALLQVNPSTDTPECSDMAKIVNEVNDSATNVEVSINGKKVPQPELLKLSTGCFKLNDYSKNIAGKAIGAGYWLFLQPLLPGKYHINISGKYLADGFSQNVKYELEVKPKP